jgi:hypothetical protein
VSFSSEDEAAEKKGIIAARKNLSNSRRFFPDVFRMVGKGLEAARKGELLMMIDQDLVGREFVAPAGKILEIRTYAAGSKRQRRLFFIEQPRKLRRKGIRAILARLPKRYHERLRRIGASRVADAVLVHLLLSTTT